MSYQPIIGTGTGVAPVVFLTWPFLSKDHVKASVNGVDAPFTWTGSSQITFNSAVASGATYVVKRTTAVDLPLVDFANGAVLTEKDLDLSRDQSLYFDQELAFTRSLVENLPAGSVLGNNGTAPGSASAITTAALTAMLPTVSPTTRGLVPQAPNDITKVLLGNGTWQPAAYGLVGPTGPAGDVAKVADRATLAAIIGPAVGATRFLTEAGREGTFVWDPSNLQARVNNDTAQGIYVPPTSAPTGASGCWVRKFDGYINVRWFGADPTAATSSDAAILSALKHMQSTRTSPSGHAGWGEGTLYFPRGRYNLSTSITNVQIGSVIGLTLRGEGQWASVIEWNSDTAHFLDLTTYIGLTIEDMSFIHVTAAAKSTWTCSLLRMSGAGGGLMLDINRVTTDGFNRIIDLTGTVNQDTNTVRHSKFQDCNTLLYSRNIQAVVNHFDTIACLGDVDYFMDVGGTGHTKVDTSNIIISGCWLRLDSNASLSGESSLYEFTKCKGEYRNMPGALPSKSRLVQLGDGTGTDNPQQNASVVFRDSALGFGIATAIDASTYILQASANVSIYFKGGYLRDFGVGVPPKIQTFACAHNPIGTRKFVSFEDMSSTILPTNVTRSEIIANTSQPAISWKNCSNVANMVLTMPAGTGVNNPSYIPESQRENTLAKDGALNLVGTQTFDLPFYSPTQVSEFEFVRKYQSSTGTLSYSIYSDPGRTVLLETVSIPAGASSTTTIFPATTATVGQILDSGQGLYVSLAVGTTSAIGYFRVKTKAL